MQFTLNCVVNDIEDMSFKDDKGKVVNYYKLYCIPTSGIKHQFIVFSSSPDLVGDLSLEVAQDLEFKLKENKNFVGQYKITI